MYLFFFFGGRLVDCILHMHIYIYIGGLVFFFFLGGGWISNFTNEHGDLMGYVHGEHWHIYGMLLVILLGG